jgi:hypothetical protein
VTQGVIWGLLAPAALALLFVGSALGHTGGSTAYAEVTVDGQTVRYTLSLPVDASGRTNPDPLSTERSPGPREYEPLARMVARQVTVAANGRPCAALPGAVQPPTPDRAIIQIVVHYACASPVRMLSLRDELFAALGRDHHTITKIEWPGGSQQVIFEPDRTEAELSLPHGAASSGAKASGVSGARAFFLLGVEHILVGFDHILFLLVLVLRGGSIKSLLLIVTAFTIAHSITLGLAVLGVVRPPTQLIEPLIALSIAYVAFENIVATHSPSRRWLASFLFGLVHGFGFAGALIELGLPSSALVSSLLFFNLGVEAGQAIIVTVLFPVLLTLSRLPGERRAVKFISAAVLTTALTLFVQRALEG